MSVIKFKSPCTCVISGPSSSGKTSFLFKILESCNDLFHQKVNKIYYFYGVWQKLFEDCKIQNIEYLSDKPTQEFIKTIADGNHNLIVIDDLQMSALNDSFIADLFTRESHHRNLTVFLILQNLFHQGKYGRDISLNTHYFVLFKNPRDKFQVKLLGRQLGMEKKLEAAYESATQTPFSYLLIDLSPSADSEYMLRGNILPHEFTVVYK